MVKNLGLGVITISMTVLFQTVGILMLTRLMTRIVAGFRLHSHSLGKTIAMVATVLGLFLIHAVEIWLWAAAYLLIGAIESLVDAVYFSTVTFSTVGFGDITLPEAWRLFSSLEGVSGFILIGWSTAYLVAASTRFGPFSTGRHF